MVTVAVKIFTHSSCKDLKLHRFFPRCSDHCTVLYSAMHHCTAAQALSFRSVWGFCSSLSSGTISIIVPGADTSRPTPGNNLAENICTVVLL